MNAFSHNQFASGDFGHRACFAHDNGCPGSHPLTLRALGSLPAIDQQIDAFWLDFARG